MPIVPVYRLHATPSEPYRRYRFARDAHPNPNPVAGRPNPDRSRWAVDRVAFYAWSDPVGDDGIHRGLAPVHEFFRVDDEGLVWYRYSMDAAPPSGWESHDYVAFWLHPPSSENAGAPIYQYRQELPKAFNHALSVAPELGESPDWSRDSMLGAAASTLPVVVSARLDREDPSRLLWSYRPTTINLAYPTTLQFIRAPASPWRFTRLEIQGGRGDFEEPVVMDDQILVRASYAHPGQDFRYDLTIDVHGGPRTTSNRTGTAPESDPGTAPSTQRSVLGRMVSDPEIVNQTPDRI
jgi:hypothetical protein